MKRKAILKKIVLNNSRYDTDIYRIISSGILDTIIPKLNEKPIIYNEENKIIDFNEHIIMLLNNFIHFFKLKFKELCPFFEYVLKRLIKENLDLFLNYLNEDKYVNCSENFSYYELWNKKLCIANFIKNTYFNSVEELFKKNNLTIKEIDKYTNKEIKDIFNILISIKNSNTDLELSILFDDVSYIFENTNISTELKTTLLIEINNLLKETINACV